jgi:YesN/AraC family two-component response regulator
MKILIVDDSEMIRRRLMDSLSGIQNIEIIGEAGNGIEAMQQIENKTPDFIIMDIRMPEMNGIAVLEKLKEQRIKSKVCILTNYPYLQYRQKCLKEGADYFFDKNRDYQEVISLVNQLSNS